MSRYNHITIQSHVDLLAMQEREPPVNGSMWEIASLALAAWYMIVRLYRNFPRGQIPQPMFLEAGRRLL